MAGRKYNQGTYRYGFNGKEEDKEWGSQMIQDYGFRIYNPTIGKFLSVDPLAPDYPWYTPYQFAGNKPIWAADLDGLEEDEKTAYKYKGNLIIVYTEYQAAVIRSQHKTNENWDVIVSEGGLNEELTQKVDAYMEAMEAIGKGHKLRNLLIKSHGNSNGLMANPKKADTDMDQFLNYDEIYSYSKYYFLKAEKGDPTTAEENSIKFSSNNGTETYNQVEALFNLGTHLENDAVIVFSNCLSGNGQLAQSVSGLFYAAHNLTDLTIYTNQDYCQETSFALDDNTGEWYPVILDGSLASGDVVINGWKKTTTSEVEEYNKSWGKLRHTEEKLGNKKDVKISTDGDPVQIISTEGN